MCVCVCVQAASQGAGAGPGPGSQQQQQEQQQGQAPQRPGEGGVKHIGSNTMGMVLDLLCFCVQHHGFRSAHSPCNALLNTVYELPMSVQQS